MFLFCFKMPCFYTALKGVKQCIEEFQRLVTLLPVSNRLLLSWVIVHMTHVREKVCDVMTCCCQVTGNDQVFVWFSGEAEQDVGAEHLDRVESDHADQPPSPQHLLPLLQVPIPGHCHQKVRFAPPETVAVGC